ncbi:hypothetical protein DDP51_08265 [Helicobacter pylori]|nr:hypothetical protein DDP51_08265 [Helicobacter pylori]
MVNQLQQLLNRCGSRCGSLLFVKYSQLSKHPNNLWVQGVGGASFISGGNGTLYGLNVAISRAKENLIFVGKKSFFENLRSDEKNIFSAILQVCRYR